MSSTELTAGKSADGEDVNDWILVTGFGPFPGVPDNPTQRLVERLVELDMGSVELVCKILDVSFERSARQLEGFLMSRSDPPKAMIHFGVADRSKLIRVEKRAVNCKSADVPDVDGMQFKGVPIDKRHAVHFMRKTSLNISILIQELQQRDVPLRESIDAGRYVCNSTYFYSLQYAASLKPQPVSLFVHIPSIGTSFEQGKTEAKWTELLLLKSAGQIVRWVVDAQSGFG